MQGDEIINAILSGYERDRERAESEAFSYREKLLANPKYSQIFYKIKELNLQIARAEFEKTENGEKLNNEKIKKLKAERQAKQKELEQTAVSAGVSPEKLKPAYLCAKCNDSGRTPNGERCECFFPRLIKVVESKLGISSRTFSSFNDFSCNITNEQTKNLLFSYCEKFDETQTRNLLITGGAGTGKTFAAECIANQLKSKGKSVVFLPAIKLNEVLLEYYKSSGSDKRYIFDYLTATDLLVIDDLGTEPILNNVTVEYITAVISERLAKQKAFIITTNFSLGEIGERYTERLLSRLSGKETKRLEIGSQDLRKLLRKSPNKTTLKAFKEGEKISTDKNKKAYKNIDALMDALDE